MHLGAKFSSLSPLEHLALVTAATEGMVNHGRLREISADHPTDITKMLARLVKDGLLVSEGVGRGMVYFLPWQERRGVTIFEHEGASLLPPELSTLTPDLSALPPELSSLTPELMNLPPDPGAQVVSDLSQLSEAEIGVLRQRAAPVSKQLRANPELVRQTVLALCDGRYLGLRVLANLLNRRDRDGKDLRTRILSPLVDEGALLRAYPKANDPRQAYITSPSASGKFQQ